MINMLKSHKDHVQRTKNTKWKRKFGGNENRDSFCISGYIKFDSPLNIGECVDFIVAVFK